MIWLTWRQHRAQALYFLVALAILAAVLVPHGLTMFRALTELGLDGCHGTANMGTACDTGRNTFSERFALPQELSMLLLFLPLLIGLFAGAPLVARELEQGTHRLVWMQGVTRRHWLLAKVGLVLAATTAFAAALSALVYWWWTPYVRAGSSRFEPLEFDLQGLVPVGYTLFAVALGIAAGALVRKVLPAMAITVAGFLAARVAVEVVRPYFRPAREARFPLFAESHPGQFFDQWLLSSHVYTADGQRLGNGFIVCGPPSAADESRACAGYQPGDYNLNRFHPGSEYWTF
ncbi:MAG TPA: ABC transporter permease subunit, partial [Acidimicrobiales bacterium]